MKKSRRLSREFVLKGLYQWRLSGAPVERIGKELREDAQFAKADEAYFDRLLGGTVAQVDSLEAVLAPHLDRPAGELSPIEHSILDLAAFELAHEPGVPYRVIINEAVELAKRFGGTDGFKFVNGVLDKLAAEMRADEIRAGRGKASV
ncbi:MAG: transcription antitermination factor NusB [Betaproteobacteria bacterium]|nr:transcription antitermination factor NusB [Betaproteobacteria bacterium]